MSAVLKEEESRKGGGAQEVSFGIAEQDIKESFRSFVKGMSESEKRRFLGIYAKYQDKGGASMHEAIKKQRQI